MKQYNYPSCRKDSLTEDWFGKKLPAPYTWLRDTHAEEVLDFTARENAFTDAWFDEGEVKAMIDALKKEHIPDPVSEIFPWKDGYIAAQYEEGNSSIVQLDAGMQVVRVLMKRDDLPGRTPFLAVPCPANENLLAILSQTDGAPRPDYLIYDWNRQSVLATLPMTFSGAWSKYRAAFYVPSTTVSGDVSRTVIQCWQAGEDGTAGTVTDVFAYPGSSIFGQVDRSEDGEYFAFSFSVNYSDNIFFMFHEKSGRITAVNDDRALEITWLGSVKDMHYFIAPGGIPEVPCPHGAVLQVPDGASIREASVFFKEEEGYLDSGFCINGSLFAHIQSCGASVLKALPDGTGVPLPEKTGALSPCGKEDSCLLLKFESFTTPPRILRFDGTVFSTVLTVSPCAGHADASSEAPACPIIVELCHAPSEEDGVSIPYYIVRREDAERNGGNRTLMYGYGGYNIYMPPWAVETVSQTNIRSWVMSGGIYIHCLLRGGNEFGPAWHEAGMAMQKKNCYHDFIGIAQQIIKEGWTRPEKIAISGCSNGGLLMSALVTMRPDLWGCVIDSVPHTDMIHFADDDRGAMYITEYGDPHESAEMFEYLLSYSPVHNVRKTAYPPVYIQTGECDNNVPPYHGKSFAAAMQASNTSDNPILLRVLEKGSHDRGQGDVFWRTIAEMHLFMEKALK